jgi:hypothetical protein
MINDPIPPQTRPPGRPTGSPLERPFAGHATFRVFSEVPTATLRRLDALGALPERVRDGTGSYHQVIPGRDLGTAWEDCTVEVLGLVLPACLVVPDPCPWLSSWRRPKTGAASGAPCRCGCGATIAAVAKPRRTS